jgi:hypothetical protein
MPADDHDGFAALTPLPGTRSYHWLATGKFDGEQMLYFDVQNPYSSSLYEQVRPGFSTSRLPSRASTGSQARHAACPRLLVAGGGRERRRAMSEDEASAVWH